MQINITARHMKLTDSVDSYVRKRIAKIGKFQDAGGVRADVVLSVEKSRQAAEIIFYVGGLSFASRGQSYDLYASIDTAADKLKKQLKKQKEVSKIRRKDNLKVLKDKKRVLEETFPICYDIKKAEEDFSGE